MAATTREDVRRTAVEMAARVLQGRYTHGEKELIIFEVLHVAYALEDYIMFGTKPKTY